MELAASRYDKGIRAVGFLNTQRHVCLKLLEQPLTQLAGGYPFTFTSSKRAVVDKEGHLQRWLIDF
ncbi:hypothetical protein D3C78_865420 [compost metagenome]